jgi:hypothetical protein
MQSVKEKHCTHCGGLEQMSSLPWRCSSIKHSSSLCFERPVKQAASTAAVFHPNGPAAASNRLIDQWIKRTISQYLQAVEWLSDELYYIPGTSDHHDRGDTTCSIHHGLNISSNTVTPEANLW